MSENLGQALSEAELMVLEYVQNPRPDLKDLIIVHYAHLVERTARRFAGVEPVEDLIQVGYIGLLNALSKFDPEAGVRFNTYATHLVAGEIKHYLRDRSQTIRMPAWLQELRARVNRTSTALQADLKRPPTEREIADALGIAEDTVRDVMQTNDILRVTSLDATPSVDEEGESDLDRLDAGDFCPDQLSVEDRLLLESAMQELRDLEKEVLTLFHFEALNQTEIANRLGISCNYVSHILRQSLSKLRRILMKQESDDRRLRADQTRDEEAYCERTGVYSDAYFRRRLTEEIHRAIGYGSVLSVVVVQFDGLDRVQGFFGPGSVEDILSDAAELLRTNVRGLDIVCRYGKESFGVILPATGPTVDVVTDRLASRFEGWTQLRGGPHSPVTVRMAQATAPDHGRSLKEILAYLRAELQTSSEQAA